LHSLIDNILNDISDENLFLKNHFRVFFVITKLAQSVES